MSSHVCKKEEKYCANHVLKIKESYNAIVYQDENFRKQNDIQNI